MKSKNFDEYLCQKFVAEIQHHYQKFYRYQKIRYKIKKNLYLKRKLNTHCLFCFVQIFIKFDT